jgi:outer membrane protein OmpA-like peptidoglycan-associated protein
MILLQLAVPFHLATGLSAAVPGRAPRGRSSANSEATMDNANLSVEQTSIRPRSWAHESVAIFRAGNDLVVENAHEIGQALAHIRRLLAQSQVNRISVLVEGHTAPDEPARLAFSRAKTVVAILRDGGISSEMIVAAEAVVNEGQPKVTVRVLA